MTNQKQRRSRKQVGSKLRVHQSQLGDSMIFKAKRVSQHFCHSYVQTILY